jgi:hypothetical protein
MFLPLRDRFQDGVKRAIDRVLKRESALHAGEGRGEENPGAFR